MNHFWGSILTVSMSMLLGTAYPAEVIERIDALHQAAASGDVQAMKRHLEMGADINAKNEEGDTALHIAANKSGFIECVIALLKEGADPNVTDKRGQSPLFRATFNAMIQRHGYTAMYQNRPKFEPELFDKDLQYAKPEDWSAEVHKELGPGKADPNALTVIKVLLDGGATPDLKDAQGFTPLDLAKAHGDYDKLAKIMGLNAKHLAGMEGSSFIMHGGATYWVTIHGGYRSSEPLRMLEKHGDKRE